MYFQPPCKHRAAELAAPSHSKHTCETCGRIYKVTVTNSQASHWKKVGLDYGMASRRASETLYRLTQIKESIDENGSNVPAKWADDWEPLEFDLQQAQNALTRLTTTFAPFNMLTVFDNETEAV